MIVEQKMNLKFLMCLFFILVFLPIVSACGAPAPSVSGNVVSDEIVRASPMYSITNNLFQLLIIFVIVLIGFYLFEKIRSRK